MRLDTYFVSFKLHKSTAACNWSDFIL